MAQSDQFNGRLGLIFASIGAAIGTETFGDFLGWLAPMEEELSNTMANFPVCMVDSAGNC